MSATTERFCASVASDRARGPRSYLRRRINPRKGPPMSDEPAPFTVNTLLGLPNKEFCDRVAAAGVDSEEKRTLKDRVAKGLRGLQWKAVERQVRHKEGQLLEIDVMSLIASAWRQ